MELADILFGPNKNFSFLFIFSGILNWEKKNMHFKIIPPTKYCFIGTTLQK